MFEKVKESVKAWAIDRVVAAVLGSAVVTAIIDAIIRYWVATPIQWRIPLVLSVFLLAYAGFWKFSEAKGWDKATVEPRWQFEPKALLTEMRYLILTGVRRAEPFVRFELVMENISGRDVCITGIRRGRAHVAGEVCNLPATIDPPILLRYPSNGERHVVAIHQPISEALAGVIPDALSIRARVVTFYLGHLEFEGTVGSGAAAVPLPPCRVYSETFRAKGPIDLIAGGDLNIIRLDGLFVSQHAYNAEGDRITT